MTSEKPVAAAMRDAAYFDQRYSDMAASPARDAIVTRTIGLPPELHFASVLPWQGVAEVTEELRLPHDGLLLDIACGRGGCGIEVARRTGARLPEAGFVHVQVHDKPEWRQADRAMWQEALAAADSDPAVRSLQSEGRRSLDTFDSLHRVFATGTAP